jgi:hypothetical protein
MSQIQSYQKNKLKRYRAFCLSLECKKRDPEISDYNRYTDLNFGIEKLVSKDVIFCPDCEHALVWRRFNASV